MTRRAGVGKPQGQKGAARPFQAAGDSSPDRGPHKGVFGPGIGAKDQMVGLHAKRLPQLPLGPLHMPLHCLQRPKRRGKWQQVTMKLDLLCPTLAPISAPIVGTLHQASIAVFPSQAPSVQSPPP